MRTLLTWARRTACAVTLAEVAIALLWHRWCRHQGYAEQAAELELSAWP